VCVTGAINGQTPQTVKKRYDRFGSFPVYKDTLVLFGSNPVEEVFFHIWYRAPREDIDALDGTFLVTITYNVTCYELRDLGAS